MSFYILYHVLSVRILAPEKKRSDLKDEMKKTRKHVIKDQKEGTTPTIKVRTRKKEKHPPSGTRKKEKHLPSGTRK